MSADTAALTNLGRRHASPLVAEGHAVGTVLGSVRGEETSLVCAGDTARHNGRPMGPDVSHELGSLSKTFTALLLAEMVERGEVAYDDPVAAHLPAHASPRSEAGRQVTLLDLATHTAGLPRTPGRVYLTMLKSGWRDPYARYTVDQLHRTAAGLRPRGRGQFRYSSLGFGLLGQALADAAGTPFPRLLTERVFRPLGLSGTAAELTPEVEAQSAIGHRRGRAAPPWHFQGLAGAGSVRATGNDMLRYLQAQLRPESTTLADALRATQVPQRPGRGGMVCLSWFRRESEGTPLFWHEGGTAGFTAFAGFAPDAGVGVFLLANSMSTRRQEVIRTARRVFKDLLTR